MPNHTRRRATNGAPLAFFEQAMLTETDECILWPYGQNRYGYGHINVVVDGRRVVRRVHVLACERSHGPAPEGHEACHGPCHARLCINPRHVAWGTRQQNMDDKVRDDTNTYGERQANHKLSEADVLSIRSLAADGYGPSRLASMFGVTHGNVSLIIRRKTWRHI